jgi:hypothetical protein
MQQSIHYVKKGLNAYMLFIIIYPYELEIYHMNSKRIAKTTWNAN